MIDSRSLSSASSLSSSRTSSTSCASSQVVRAKPSSSGPSIGIDWHAAAEGIDRAVVASYRPPRTRAEKMAEDVADAGAVVLGLVGLFLVLCASNDDVSPNPSVPADDDFEPLDSSDSRSCVTRW
ncbi:MAG: hypothetical protein RDU25_00170 [Patescibacteria group bacterium]|nr:hypothetical protein [Patescibacteria group bacterium]